MCRPCFHPSDEDLSPGTPVLEQQPYSGHVFILCGRRGDIVKYLWFNGDGLCLLAKRLEKGRFVWPKARSGTISLSRAQLSQHRTLYRLLSLVAWRHRILQHLSNRLAQYPKNSLATAR
jgi:transposase